MEKKVQGRVLSERDYFWDVRSNTQDDRITNTSKSKQSSHTPKPYGMGRMAIFDFPVSIQLTDITGRSKHRNIGHRDFVSGVEMVLSKHNLLGSTGLRGDPLVGLPMPSNRKIRKY